MNKGVDARGMFWLESSPEAKVPGHLTFDPKKGGRLALHGTFVNHDRQTRYERVVGDVGGRSCVLLECFEVGQTTYDTGDGDWESHITLLVNMAVMAPRRKAPTADAKFAGAFMTFTGLSEFDGRIPFSFNRPTDDDDWTEQVQVRQLDKRRVEADEMTVELIHSPGYAGARSLGRESVTSKHYCHLILSEPGSLDDVLEAFTWVRDWVAIAVHSDCRIVGPFQLTPEEPEDARFGTTEFHGVWPRARKTRRPVFIDRVMKFDDLGADGVRRLLNLRAELDHVVRRVASMRFERGVAFEDAIIRMVSAADGLHRELTGRQREPAKTMLLESAAAVGPRFIGLVPDLDRWATDIVNVRDDAAHNKGRPLQRVALAEPMVSSVYWLTVLRLLVHAGVGEPALDAVIGSQPFIAAMGAVREAYPLPPV